MHADNSLDEDVVNLGNPREQGLDKIESRSHARMQRRQRKNKNYSNTALQRVVVVIDCGEKSTVIGKYFGVPL